ncbi:type II secretion system F family protein [Clostridium disporicum]|uniref:Type II secretory pathway, component PulF n=1 Tax=Clostridium disporicum TaxID=84024 RepID=A0A174HRP1_9CLOT|nr:type II secretion system F family protein [Clostridium disporicum]CUO75750.1 type II secretory pathway%2C component PulF [Clostridium disporicum]
MPIYVYEGKTLNGSVEKGKAEYLNINAARESLRGKGIFINSIKEETASMNIEFNFKKNIPYQDLAIFCRQLHFGLAAGIPILRAIGMIKDQIEHKKLKSILTNVYEEIQKGSALSEVLGQHKEIPYMLTAMVEVGEATGNIDQIMGEMAEYYDKQHRQKKTIDAALTYPKFLLAFSICIVIGLVTFVVPTFVDSILSAGQELPLPTQALIAISDFIKNNFLLLTVVAIGLYIIKLTLIDTNPKVQYEKDRFLVTNKKLSPITQQIFTARFARTFALLVQGGMSVMNGLEIAGNAVDNRYIKKMIEECNYMIQKGQGIGDSLETRKIFPKMMTQMMKVGEETGSIDDILKKTSEYYEIEAEFAIKKLTALIEPVMIVFLAFIVGFVVISLAMPMFQVMGAV